MTLAAVRKFLTHPDCVIFVGSGISQWSGLPSWAGLLNQLASFLEDEGFTADLVRREIKNGDLLQAASYGVSKLTPAAFGTFIRRAAQQGVAVPHEIHKAIVNLGPSAFVTTNYDTLIEQALSIWRSDTFFPPPVSNKHLVELADIVSAQSSHFVFKPHGDVADATSIVLTREQYRMLLPSGERHRALEALKTLLVTRPVLYLGFGLRDPDFLYLRDLLLNLYQGAVRDHWAIMPNVNIEEVDYWRNQYGIKLLSYEVKLKEDGSSDHGGLLSMLLDLLPSTLTVAPQPIPAEIQKEWNSAERVLALTRYTSGLARRLAPSISPVVARISRLQTVREQGFTLGIYENWTTTKFLIDGPQASYLIGLPGAGKSFAVRIATCQLAEKLQSACMEDALVEAGQTLPILLDLKLYRGNLRSQINAELPAGFPIEQLRGNLRVKLFLDAFNEMPSQYIETATFNRELEALGSEIDDLDYVITSRTTDGIPDRPSESHLYEIDRFEDNYVQATLSAKGISISGIFADDLKYLLSRPFFLQLVSRELIEVGKDATPRDLYASYFSKLQAEFSKRFATDLQLLQMFAKVAYRAMDLQAEAFPMSWLYDLITAFSHSDEKLVPEDVVNWLIAREVLVGHTGRRGSFVHQSLTEFCAAIELQRRSEADVISLRETIASKRWDQCLFLALAMMKPELSKLAMSYALDADVNLAVNAVRYAEFEQSTAVTTMLAALIKQMGNVNQDSFLNLSLSHLPVGPEHVAQLRELLKFGNTVASEAVLLLAQVLDKDFKSELLNLLELYVDDFNFSVNGIARALGPLILRDDIPKLISIADIWSTKLKTADNLTAIGDILGHIESEHLKNAFEEFEISKYPYIIDLFGQALRLKQDDSGFKYLSELLLQYPIEIVSSFRLSLFRENNLSESNLEFINTHHIDAIWSTRFTKSLWKDAITELCRADESLRNYSLEIAGQCKGVEAIALTYCANGDSDQLFASLAQLLDQEDQAINDEPFQLIDFPELPWKGREHLLVASLARGVSNFRYALLDPNGYNSIRKGCAALHELKPVIELARDEDANLSWWQNRGLGAIVAQLGNREVAEYCLKALVSGPSWMQRWVKEHFISASSDLSTDDLNDDMIASLLSDLSIPGRIQYWQYDPLGSIATESFVQERLLPLASTANSTFRENLKVVLKTAGDRHARRYILTG